MAWCLMAPSHYMNQCLLMISEWRSPEVNFTGNTQDIYLWYQFENDWFNITATSPRGQWVNNLVSWRSCDVTIMKFLSSSRYNWQGALVIQAGIFLNGIVFGALLRPPPPKPSPIVKTSNMMSELELSQKKKKKSCCSLSFRQFLPFYIFLFGYFCIQLGHMTLYTYTPVKCDGIGMPRTKASFLISLMGITGIFARPVIGLLGDCRWANRTILIGISALGVGAATMVSTQLVSYVPLAIFSGTFGFLSCK